MNANDIRVGEEVTWANGEVRARVEALLPASEQIHVELTQPYRAPCGDVFPEGTPLTIPVGMVRSIS